MIRKFFSLFLFIILYNALFYLCKTLDNEFQLYFLGFRLNLFLLINFLSLLILKPKWNELSPFLKHIGKLKNWINVFLVPILIIILLFVIALILGKIKYLNPKYFFEFGVTSLIDIPIYYTWTLPITFSLACLMFLWIGRINFFSILKFSSLLTLAFFLFKYNPKQFNLFNNLHTYLLIFSYFIFQYALFNKFKSVLLLSFSLFWVFYPFIILFGSNDSLLLHTFFARGYDKWEGILTIILPINYSTQYIMSISLILIGLFFFILEKKNS